MNANMPGARLLLMIGALSLGSLTPIRASAADQPNFVVILADDMGYADAGFTGATDIQTPSLDELAASGVIFRQGYVNHPYCAPSRAAFLSGRYQHRFGFEANPAYDPGNPVMGIDPGEKLFPARLQEAGYVTGGVGKWHLGAASEFHPNNRGFDYFYGFLGGGHDYFQIDLTKPVRTAYLQGLVRNDKPATFEGYLTTALSSDAVEFIGRSKDKPFFLYLAYNAPHGPLQAPQEDIQRYAHIEQRPRRIYAAMVDVMDRGIGNVMAALEKHGLRENTLIFFFSDNGGPVGGQPGWRNGSSNAPFRGGKVNFYDGGVHVPFIASWPARIPAGTTFDLPVISLDIARTIVEQAGADPASDNGMEGKDLIPYVLGERDGAPHDALYWRGVNGRRGAILSAQGTKYIRERLDSEPEMFHLPDDIAEENNLIAERPDLAAELSQQWDEWDESNVPARFFNYIDYFRDRDQFYFDVIPESARESGYQPQIKTKL